MFVLVVGGGGCVVLVTVVVLSLILVLVLSTVLVPLNLLLSLALSGCVRLLVPLNLLLSLPCWLWPPTSQRNIVWTKSKPKNCAFEAGHHRCCLYSVIANNTVQTTLYNCKQPV